MRITIICITSFRFEKEKHEKLFQEKRNLVLITYLFVIVGAESGMHERRLLNDLLANYNKLERPVVNESEAVMLSFGLTLQQIIDVVSSS